LAGGGRLTASSSGVNASESGFVMAPGAGLDFMLRHRLAVRVVEADYLLTRLRSGWIGGYAEQFPDFGGIGFSVRQ